MRMLISQVAMPSDLVPLLPRAPAQTSRAASLSTLVVFVAVAVVAAVVVGIGIVVEVRLSVDGTVEQEHFHRLHPRRCKTLMMTVAVVLIV